MTLIYLNNVIELNIIEDKKLIAIHYKVIWHPYNKNWLYIL
tara:strand:+ start:167 stop:289 length:123 start_codon:yes stop_codon:yes gene_type:complete